MGKGGGGNNANSEAYLLLSLTVLAAFARVSQLAATDDMLSKIPLILEVMSKEYVTLPFGVNSIYAVACSGIKSHHFYCFDFLNAHILLFGDDVLSRTQTTALQLSITFCMYRAISS